MTVQYSVLIVDDEFGLAEMLRDMLEELGYNVALAINGRVALDILEERKVDLVITDLMMPVIDGYELAIAIRNSETHRHTPIIMMSSLPSEIPRQSGLFAAVIRKPFTPDLLLQVMLATLTESDNNGQNALSATSSRRDPDNPGRGDPSPG